MAFLVRNPVVPCHLFSEIFAKKKICRKNISVIVTWQDLDSKANRSHSGIKQHPYWLPARKNLIGGGGEGGGRGVIRFSIRFSLYCFSFENVRGTH